MTESAVSPGPTNLRSVTGPVGYSPPAGSNVGSVRNRTPPNSNRQDGPPMYVTLIFSVSITFWMQREILGFWFRYESGEPHSEQKFPGSVVDPASANSCCPLISPNQTFFPCATEAR